MTDMTEYEEFVAPLQPFRVEPPVGTGIDPESLEAAGYPASDDTPVGTLAEAHVISSLRRERSTGAPDFLDDGSRHDVVLDIDLPAMLIPSSTEGHSHLIVRLSEGVSTSDYIQFLWAAAKIGLIEDGYAKVSGRRGRTDVRLPWVPKGEWRALLEVDA